MNVLKKAYINLFFIGMFLLPFNSDVPKWLGFLGEFKRDSSPIFFLISFLLLLILSAVRGRIFIPIKSKEFVLWTAFIFVILLTTLINGPVIIGYYFKQTNGFERFIRQFISLIISGGVLFVLYLNVCHDLGVKQLFFRVRKIFLFSFSLVTICGVLQYLILTHGLIGLKPISDLFNYLPFVDIVYDFKIHRLTSITYEPPALGSYLLTVSGFMFSYIFTSNKSTRFIPFILVVLLCVFARSRTALIVIIVQCLFGIYYAYKKLPKFRTIFTKMTLFSIIVMTLLLIFKGNSIIEVVGERINELNFIGNIDRTSRGLSVSNKSRMGIQYANFQVAKENPFFGVGWGQQAYEAKEYYPEWAIIHNYEFRDMYLNEKVRSFPPGYNMYLRIWTEVGVFGLLLFLLFLFVVLKNTIIRFNNKKELNYVTIALMISFFGYFLNWIQIDSFRQYGFWLCLALLIKLKTYNNEQAHSINTSL